MSVLVEIPGALSRYSNGEETLSVEAETVGGVLEAVWQRFPELRTRVLDSNDTVYPYLLLAVNHQPIPRGQLDRTVTTGDRVEIIALADGG